MILCFLFIYVILGVKRSVDLYHMHTSLIHRLTRVHSNLIIVYYQYILFRCPQQTIVSYPTLSHPTGKTLRTVEIRQSQVTQLCSRIFEDFARNEVTADATINAGDLVEKLQQQLMNQNTDSESQRNLLMAPSSPDLQNQLREDVGECFKTLAVFKLQLQPALRRQHTLRRKRAGWKAGQRRRSSPRSTFVMRMRTFNQHRRDASHPVLEDPGLLGDSDSNLILQDFQPSKEQEHDPKYNSTPAYHIVPVGSSTDQIEHEESAGSPASDKEVHEYESNVDVS